MTKYLLQRHWSAAPNVEVNDPTSKTHGLGHAKFATIIPPPNDFPYLKN